MNLKEFTEKYGNKEVEEAKLKELLGIKDNKVWKPRLNDAYWLIDGGCGISIGVWGNTPIDENRFRIGNCYKTKEEAIFARDKQIFMTKLERDFIENSDEIDWGNRSQNKYHMYVWVGGIRIDCYNLDLGVPVTTNKKWLENYIKENEEDIKKYYFGKGE